MTSLYTIGILLKSRSTLSKYLKRFAPNAYASLQGGNLCSSCKEFSKFENILKENISLSFYIINFFENTFLF